MSLNNHTMSLVLVSNHIEPSSIKEHGPKNEDLKTILVVPQILLGEAHLKMRSSYPFGKAWNS